MMSRTFIACRPVPLVVLTQGSALDGAPVIGGGADRRFGELRSDRHPVPREAGCLQTYSKAPIVAVVAWQSGKTNGPMVEAWRRLGIAARLLTPDKAGLLLNADDVAVIGLDVLPTLDGVEDGLDDVVQLERRGIRVLNTPSALVAAHDKLETARRLDRAGLPHPRTFHVETLAELAAAAVRRLGPGRDAL